MHSEDGVVHPYNLGTLAWKFKLQRDTAPLALTTLWVEIELLGRQL
jgi:hypothetical protein